MEEDVDELIEDIKELGEIERQLAGIKVENRNLITTYQSDPLFRELVHRHNTIVDLLPKYFSYKTVEGIVKVRKEEAGLNFEGKISDMLDEIEDILDEYLPRPGAKELYEKIKDIVDKYK